MNKEYKIKLDLNKKLYNKKMAFNQFDENVNDFYIEVTKNNEVVKDLDKSIITLVAIKPNNAVDAQFIEVKEGQIYADLKPSMCDLVGNYQAKAMIVLEGEIVTTDTINYSVNEDKIISRLNEDVVSDERFTLFTDALARLSDIEASEEQRIVNEAERILAEENRKIEEAKRVEAELNRQHEEADRAKYDATRESNENIRKINEEARISSENVRLENEANRIEQEANRAKAEQLRKDNYNSMTEDEERRRLEANAHKEAEVLRVQAETNRVNEEAKRRTTEQTRVSAENTRVSNENTRKANEVTRQTNETQRVEAETQRQNRYNSFISDAEANANEFENYTNTAKANEEERKANELDRKSQEARRVSNEVERISNENTRKASEITRESNEATRQNTFSNKVSEIDKKIVEINATKDNLISSVTTKVDNKVSEIDEAKSDMTTTVSNKIDEVETRFNALTTSQQQDAEVIDARTDFKGEVFDSLKDRIDYTDKLLRDSTVSTVETESDFTTVEATSNGYFEDVKLEGRTLVNLCKKTSHTIIGQDDNSWSKHIMLTKPLVTGNKYTLIANVKTYTLDEGYSIFGRAGSIHSSDTQYGLLQITKGGIHKHVFIAQKDIVSLSIADENNSTSGESLIEDFILLEGDHTQNPPNYFEGLKSVGQSATTSDDGADEISVESVNENLLDLTGGFDTFPSKPEKVTCTIGNNSITIKSSDWVGYYGHIVPVKKGKLYYSFDITYYILVVILDSNGNKLKELGNDNQTNVATLKGSLDISEDSYIKIQYRYATADNLEGTVSNACISQKVQDYTPHQSDKKRLLYYNEETQTWEKPILREWDSIEKHANGKYYYHQRSGEVVLNGSEDWKFNTQSESVIRFALDASSIDMAGNRSPVMSDKFRLTTVYDISSNEESIFTSIGGSTLFITITESKLSTQDEAGFKQWLQANNVTVVYQLAQEKVYECTNIDLITYANETNYIVESGAIVPKSILKVHNNISNVVNLLQKKVSILESNMTSYMITQNRLMLASRYNADSVSFKVDVATLRNSFEYDNDLYELILNNILVGKDNYNREYIENLIIFYWMDFVISDEMYSTLFEIIEEQHNPKIEEETPLI